MWPICMSNLAYRMCTRRPSASSNAGGGNWKLSLQFIELPSARHALAASAPQHLPTADAVVYVYDCTDRK